MPIGVGEALTVSANACHELDRRTGRRVTFAQRLCPTAKSQRMPGGSVADKFRIQFRQFGLA